MLCMQNRSISEENTWRWGISSCRRAWIGASIPLQSVPILKQTIFYRQFFCLKVICYTDFANLRQMAAEGTKIETPWSDIKSRERKCIICEGEFSVKYPSAKTKTCSKQCKSELSRQKTKEYFTPENRDRWSKMAKELGQTPEYKAKFEEGIKNRRSYKKEGHPRWGKKWNEEERKKISEGLLKNKEKEDVEGLISVVRDNYEKNKGKMFDFEDKKHYRKTHLARITKLYRLKRDRGGKCVDCGENNLCMLEFDHLGNKTDIVLNMKFDEMETESKKCVMRCHNCHVIKSHKENYNKRTELLSENPRNMSNRVLRMQRRNYISTIKKTVGGCQKCEKKYEDNPYVFDFDHIEREDKKRGIVWYVSHGSSVKLINEEIKKCVLLCKNCHGLRTRKQLGFYFCNMVDVEKAFVD